MEALPEVGNVSLLLRPLPDVPEETARVAHAVFPRATVAMQARDVLGSMFSDADFVDLFPARGRPALSPARLALVSVLQFVEGLTDRQAADAVRARIDWKYALGLELTDAGFDFSVLSEFRLRLVTEGREQRLLQAVLKAAGGGGLLRPGGRIRTDSTHVLGTLRVVNRLELVQESMRSALNSLAAAAPKWLVRHVEPAWFDRYSHRCEDFRLPQQPRERAELALSTGRDGRHLLQAVFRPSAPPWLREIPAVDTLRQVWVQQYLVDGRGRTQWRQQDNLPPGAVRIESAYELQARRSIKRSTAWTGYKVHLTEVCEPYAPHLITDVVTTAATVQDVEVTAGVHARLDSRGLLPQEHLADTAYVDAQLLVSAASEHGVDLIGPARADTSWQATHDGYTVADFAIDWQQHRLTCPNGSVSSPWRAITKRGTPAIRVQFSATDCIPCPLRLRCTRQARYRELTLLPRAQHDALLRRRKEQITDAWKKRYAARQGMEGTIGQAANAYQLRRCRYRGLAKTRLQHELTACAINLVRICAWRDGTPLAPTRTSHFAAMLYSP